MQALRAAIPARARASRDAALVERLLALPEVARARSIALFCPMPGKAEVDLRTLDAHQRSQGRAVYYPRLGEPDEGGGIGDFAMTGSLEELSPGRLGFCEPNAATPPAVPGDLDVIVVPALAASAAGHRLGYGAGFYDRVLPRHCPPAFAVVVVYDFQFLGELPTLDHDFACPVVVTDTRTVRVESGR
jgi:5-formyltetrahydrofolate cyclo-ligase